MDEQLKDVLLRPTAMYEQLTRDLNDLKELKPDDRSDLDRRYAIVITDLEKVIAYFKVYVVR